MKAEDRLRTDDLQDSYEAVEHLHRLAREAIALLREMPVWSQLNPSPSCHCDLCEYGRRARKFLDGEGVEK